MIASVPQFAPRMETPESGVPVRKMSAGAGKGGAPRNINTVPLPKVRLAPDDEEPNPGGVPPKPNPTTQNPLSLLAQAQANTQTNPQPSGATVAFSRAWAEALEQSESTTAQRLRSTKGLVMPVASPKADPQTRTNENAVSGVFSNEKSTPLPLILSIPSFANQPQTPPQAKNPRATAGSSATKPISEADSEEAESTQLSAPGELAFSAKLKSPAPEESFNVPTGTPAPPKPVIAPPVLKTAVESAPVAAYAAVAPIPVAAPTATPVAAPPIVTASESAPSAASISVSSPLQSEPISAPAAPATAPQPIKEIAFQLPGSHNVEVRLTEHLGEVRIDVRSGDPGLTQDLRGNLHELVSGLERKGFAADVSHQPQQAAAPAGRSSDTSSSKDQDQGGQSGAFDRQPQQRNRQPGQPAEPSSAKARASAWNQQANTSFGKDNS